MIHLMLYKYFNFNLSREDYIRGMYPYGAYTLFFIL